MRLKIEKVKNFNQILLAVAGTLGLILLLTFAISLLFEFWSHGSSRNQVNNQAILAPAVTEVLQADSLRKQIISFNKIEVIDSATQTFLLPVTQANLAVAERDEQATPTRNKENFSKSYERNNSVSYNNLLLFNAATQTSSIVFDKRVSISYYDVVPTKEGKYIIVSGCSTDSNKDRFLDGSDLQQLFVYDLAAGKLHEIKASENYTTIEAWKPHYAQDLVVHFGFDRNKNGVFDRQTEPMVYYRLNFRNLQLEEFATANNMKHLQDLLEGK